MFKNFLVFFSLLELLLVMLFLQLYQNDKKDYSKELLHNMQLCSYSLSCNQYSVDFAPKNKNELNRLYHEKEGIDAYFFIPESKKYVMRLHYPLEAYRHDLYTIKKKLFFMFITLSLLLLGLSLFFTFYSLRPIRKALQINDEFIKDILHDFNTPIASMLLNINMYNSEKGEDAYIRRVSHSLKTIVMLQENLKTFLYNSPSQIDRVDVAALLKERVALIAPLYPRIRFDFEKGAEFHCKTNRELLARIVDNLLTNAAKYNKPSGSVKVTVNRGSVVIQDSGKGIKDIERVLQRYYKEQERGLGLGLHIVQKLAQELNIRVEFKSQQGIGTEVILSFPSAGVRV